MYEFVVETTSTRDNESAKPAMSHDSLLPFDLPAVCRRHVTAAFDGGLISSDGGLLLLRAAERRLGLADLLASCLRDRRDPALIDHTLAEMLRFRMLAIACGYEDADDCGALRCDPLFKLAVGREPESGDPLCSQPSMSRCENMASRSQAARMTAALLDLFCRSFPAPPEPITLDIDDTCDAVHGQQQLSLFNAHYDTRCFLPIHVYHVESGKPVAVLLRPGKTPSGAEVRSILRHLIGRIRRHWPETRITIRGDSHYARPEAMEWCEANGVDYIFGLAGNTALNPLTAQLADDLKVRRAERRERRRCAALPPSPTPPNPGRAGAGSSPASRPPRGASTPAISSPRSRAMPAISTRMSIAPAARPRT